MAEEKLTAASYQERLHRLIDLAEPLFVAGLYVTAVFSWIYGLFFGIVTLAGCRLEANKRVGKICLILAAVNIALVGCLVVAYVLFALFALGLYASLSPSSLYGG